jgi:cell division protein FtsQ
MTMKQIANRTLMHWKVLMLLIGLGVTGSIAASGLSHLLQDVLIRQVQLQGDLRYLDADSLTRDLSIRFNGNYLDTTLGQVISEVESHPWIASASARRVWPDTLLIEITEQRPVAIYNDTQYLGLSGDLFEPPRSVDEPLPRLYGALSETMQVYSHYGVFSDRLSDFSTVVSVSRGHDMGWEISLENGINVQLGRDDILGRLSRARDVLDRLDDHKLARLQEIDARYDNGVALAWRAVE